MLEPKTLRAVPAIALALAAVTLAAAQETIPLTSPVYRDLDDLYLLCGLGTPSNARPWSVEEAALILGRIDPGVLHGSAVALYATVSAALAPRPLVTSPDGFSFDAVLDTNLDAYAHSNTGFDTEADWVMGFTERRPMARLALSFGVDGIFHAYCDGKYGRNRFLIEDDLARIADVYPDGVGSTVGPIAPGLVSTSSAVFGPSLLSNVFPHSHDFDFQWPKRAVFSVGGARWNLSLARDRASWGNGRSGNFIIDGHGDWLDYARLKVFADAFTYDWMNVFLETDTATFERPQESFRVFLAHRLEFRILPTLTLAMSEDAMYANDVFDLRYLNPAFVFHNFNNRSMFNSIMHLEADWNFMPGLSLYGQFALDQGRAPNEAAAQADAVAWLAGLEGAVAVGPGILSGAAEFALTDPVLYRHDIIDYIIFRRYFVHGSPAGIGFVTDLDYLGYPYGGDALLGRLEAGFRVPGSLSLSFVATGMRHGVMGFAMSHNTSGNNAGYANYAGETPSGDRVAESLALGLSAEWPVPRLLPWRKATLWGRLDWVGRRTWVRASGAYETPESDMQAAAGIALSW